jgi:hypothetical protein
MTSFDDRDDAEEVASFAPVTLSAHHPVQGRSILDELEQYWRDLRGARRIPVRSEVDPARIDSALPHSFILDRVAPGIGRLRVAGQKLSALVGTEVRGMPLTTFFTADARDMVMQQTEAVFARPALVEVPLVSVRSLGRPKLTGRMLLLPLLGPEGHVSRALGAILIDGMIGRLPRRFDIPEGQLLRCEDLPEPRLHAVSRSAVAGHRAEPVWPDKRPDVARPALRLVVSND